MKTDLADIVCYIKDVLGVPLSPKLWIGSARLPLYLRQAFSLYKAHILGVPCLLAVHRENREESPLSMQKMLDQIRARAGAYELILVRSAISAHNRKRLIERKIPFIVPGNQLYLPVAGIDFREHFKKLREKPALFSPSAQSVVIESLHRNPGERLRLLDLARKLGYSVMAISRAFDELEQADILKIPKVGRDRLLEVPRDKKSLWEAARPLLRNPVKKRLYATLSRPPAEPLAGISALAQLSMIAEPPNPCIAVHGPRWKMLRGTLRPEIVQYCEPGGWEIELWHYDPRSLAHDNAVDRFSLFLSLEKCGDERVEGALEKMMEDVKW